MQRASNNWGSRRESKRSFVRDNFRCSNLEEPQLAKCHAHALLAKDARAIGHHQGKEDWDLVRVRQSQPCIVF
jgi:hypothetical protein